MNPTPVPVLQSVAAAYAFFVSHWQRALIAALPYTVLYAAQIAMMGPMTATEASPALGLLAGLVWVGTLLSSLALSASVLRMAVKGDYSGRYGLKLGGDEFRILGVNILIAVLTILIFIMVFAFWAVVYGTIADSALERAGINPQVEGFDLDQANSYLTTADWTAVVLVGLAGAGIMVWLSARLVLALPATIDKGRILVLSIWPLTNGNAWRIAAAMLLTSLPLMLIELVVLEAINAILGARFLFQPVVIGPDAVPSETMGRLQEYMRWWGLMAGVNVPVISGLYAYIYRQRIKSDA